LKKILRPGKKINNFRYEGSEDPYQSTDWFRAGSKTSYTCITLALMACLAVQLNMPLELIIDHFLIYQDSGMSQDGLVEH
jgi:hypothetical protein